MLGRIPRGNMTSKDPESNFKLKKKKKSTRTHLASSKTIKILHVIQDGGFKRGEAVNNSGVSRGRRKHL